MMASKYTPHEYQAHAIQQIKDNPRYVLFLGMGLGKSVISLTARQTEYQIIINI